MSAFGTGNARLGGALTFKAVEQGRYDYKPTVNIETFQQDAFQLTLHPRTALTSEGPWNFQVPSIETHAIDMRYIELYCQAKIVNDAGGNIAPEIMDKAVVAEADRMTTFDVVAPCNLLASSITQTVDLALNGRPFPTESGQYANYKAYMETMLSYSDDSRKTHLQSQLYAVDQPHKMESKIVHDRKQTNMGFQHRYQRVEGSKVFEFIGPIQHPFLKANNTLASTNNLEIRLQRPSDKFLLTTNKPNSKFKIEILKLLVYVPYIRLSENYKPPDSQVYIYSDSVMRQIVLNPATPSAVIQLTNQEEIMPKCVNFGMTTTTSVIGNYEENPYNFQTFDISELCIIINGRRYPNDPLQFDFTNDEHPAEVIRAYRWVFRNVGMLQPNRGNSMSLELFQGGSFIVPFDLTPDGCSQTHDHRARRAKVEIEIKFRSALDKNVTVHCEMIRKKACIVDGKTGNFEIVEVTV